MQRAEFLEVLLDAVRGQRLVVADGDGELDVVLLTEVVQPIQELLGLQVGLALHDLGQAVDEDVGDVVVAGVQAADKTADGLVAVELIFLRVDQANAIVDIVSHGGIGLNADHVARLVLRRVVDEINELRFLALNVLAVGIHPYFLPMTYAITLALLLEYALHNRQLAGPGLYLAANFSGTALLGWALGLLYGSASSGGQALYGYFCMNLNALWNPVGVNGVLYSRVLPAQNQVYGNYDAFAYLGLGVRIALPIAVVLLRRQLGGMLRRHWALACCCAVLTVFAISNVITANGATLATLPLPASLIKLFSIFRSSGRLFWPIYYLQMLLTLVGLARLKGRWLLAGAALLAVVQVWDVSPGMVQRSAAMLQAMQTDAFPTEMESDFWQAAQQYTAVVSMDEIQDDALHLALFAADNGMTTNDPFAARYDETALAAQRETLLAELAAGTVREDTL